MTPATIPAYRPSYTRKLRHFPKALVWCVFGSILLHHDMEEVEAMITFGVTEYFDGEPGTQEFYNRFVQWKKRGEP